jgi:hypothetical protein
MRELVLDVSKWDGDMDFAEWVQMRDLYGVIVKGGGSDVGRYTDSWFARNYDKCVAAGIHVGAYFYSKALSVSEAVADAEYFIDNCLDGRDWDLPAYIDVEEQAQFDLGKRALTDICKAFMDRLQERGYKAGIYTGGYAFNGNMYGADELGEYADWIAAWSPSMPDYVGVTYGMWQQGGIRLSDGNVVYDDVPGYHDCDWALIDYPSMISGGVPITTPETTTPTGSVEDVMRVAYGELGYYAPDDPVKGSKYGRWMAEYTGEDWMAGWSTEIWWCCMFVSWVLHHAGVRCAGFPSQNTDVALNNGARAHLVDKSQIQRGDILIFDWNWATDATDHIGFATDVPCDGCVDTIEGNVGNAVAERTRDLSTIRYVVRPDYEGQEATPSGAVVRPDYDADLVIDGSAGHLTVHKWQVQMGTYADGVISGQVADYYKYRSSVYSIEHDGGSGSQLVRAVQAKVGATVDGIWGPETSRKVQEWLVANGYDVGTAGVDDHFGHDSVCALQLSLNDEAWS